MYIVGQERRLVDPPSQVVAGVRTVTTNMDGRDALPRMSRPFAFYYVMRSGPVPDFHGISAPMHRLEISLKQEARRSEINIGRGIRRKLGQLLPLEGSTSSWNHLQQASF